MKTYRLVAKIEGKSQDKILDKWQMIVDEEIVNDYERLIVSEDYYIKRRVTDNYISYLHYKGVGWFNKLVKICVYELEG